MEDRFGLSPELKEHMNQEEERRLNEEYREAVRVLDEFRESMSGEPMPLQQLPDPSTDDPEYLEQFKKQFDAVEL
jgi:hypothetical protein